MLSQNEADELMGMIKEIENRFPIPFPCPGDYIQIEARSNNGHEVFLFDVNRKSIAKPQKCTYQERYSKTEILLRLDIDGPTHTNPNGEEVPCPHLHIYRDGYADKWAFPLPQEFNNIHKLHKTLEDFLKYSNVIDIPKIQLSID